MNGWILENNFGASTKAEIERANRYNEMMEKREAEATARKAAKKGLTVEAYKKAEAEKAAERARIAKVRRYTKELEEMKARMAYMEKWLAENA